jgi:hypothetical protein
MGELWEKIYLYLELLHEKLWKYELEITSGHQACTIFKYYLTTSKEGVY